MARVVHFELPADDPTRAKGFYTGVFGWTFTEWEGEGGGGYWLVDTGEGTGINGGMAKRGSFLPVVTNVIDVPNVDEFSEKVKAAGGEIVAPKMPVPTVGYLAYFKDTEGNLFGMMQYDDAAA
ncbi:MAG TPA: VOC family protein [Armatimonadota bacterium]|jgi:hypothetical protein